MYNKFIAHLRTKYENDETHLKITSSTASSFDGSFEVFVSLNDEQPVQVWSMLNGEGKFTQQNLEILDQRILKVQRK